jgi:hypothetical protein
VSGRRALRAASAGAPAAVKVLRDRVDDLTVTHRPLALALAPLLALPALAGCAGGPARAAGPAATHRARTPVASTSAVAGPRVAALPAPCSLVSVEDLGLYVALASWDQSSGDQDGRSVCRFTTDGFTVTTVTMRLADPQEPPAGLCLPPGATATRPATDLLCGYSGPTADAATAVGARSGLAIGVRVTGPGAAEHATTLAQHALSHL